MLILVLGWAVVIGLLYRREGMAGPLSPTWRRGLFIALMLTTLATFCRYMFPLEGYVEAFPIDDSYITLTAARNFAAMNILAVNPRIPLSAVTSPLHVLLIGLLAKVMAVEIANRVVGLLAYLALSWGVFNWSQRLGASFHASLATAVVTISCGPLTFGALNGMETTFFAALLIWIFYCYERTADRPRWFYPLGMLIGAAILTRPEGWFAALVIYAVAGWRWWKNRQEQSLTPLLVSGSLALLTIAPYLLAELYYNGAMFPVTVSAKKHFFSDGCLPLLSKASITFFTIWLMFAPYLVLLPLLYWSRPFLRRVYPWAFILVFYAAYTSQFPGALGHYWGRYQHPLLPILLTGAIAGADELYRRLFRPDWWRHLIVGGIVLLYLTVITAIGGTMQLGVYRNALVNAQAYLMNITDWIRANTEPGDIIGTHDIGALYYFGERPVLDLVGLADPEIARVYAEAPPLCEGNDKRRQRLYQVVRKHRPTMLYFTPQWDGFFLRLTYTDRGRHLRKVNSYKHAYQMSGDDEVTIYEYNFYRCEWNKDLRKEPQ
ncbi:MAG TPA: hypothetical protein PKW95_16330 [bacterium]|nr:hypothetical protein [bacterium]